MKDTLFCNVKNTRSLDRMRYIAKILPILCKTPIYQSINLSIFPQVNFTGLTGPVSFDENGYRKNYEIHVSRVGLNQPPLRVSQLASTAATFTKRERKRERDCFVRKYLKRPYRH